jgi:glycosyl-4,4'-diaponeurosporenoate acyltransferase
MTPVASAVVDAVAWFAIQVGTGYFVHRLPAITFEDDGPLWRARAFEDGGRFYARWFLVRRWKHLLPEGGDVFAGGISKRRLPGRDQASLRLYARETRRGEAGHWLAMAFLPLFALWNPAWLMPFMALYAIVTNVPCIVAMRYNRLRIERITARASARADRA